MVRVVGRDEHFEWLLWIVKATILLNFFDAALTMFWISSGAASEANPLLDVALTWGPLAFVGIKVALVSLGSLLLWRLRRRHLAVICIFIAFCAYYFILLYHLKAMELNLLERFF